MSAVATGSCQGVRRGLSVEARPKPPRMPKPTTSAGRGRAPPINPVDGHVGRRLDAA